MNKDSVLEVWGDKSGSLLNKDSNYHLRSSFWVWNRIKRVILGVVNDHRGPIFIGFGGLAGNVEGSNRPFAIELQVIPA